MIQNLNQVNFQGFGTVLPERAQTETYQHSYLDKSVSIRPGVLFSLSVYKNEATVTLSTEEQPERVGVDVSRSMRIDSQLRVAGIYTFFYQEKEQGFLFPGESHPMPELTYVDQGSLHSVAEGQDLLLKQGDLVIYGPGQWHMQYADIGVAPRYVTISFASRGNQLNALLNRKFTAPQKAVTLLQNMLREQETTDALSGDIILCQLNLLLLLLLRETTAPTGGKYIRRGKFADSCGTAPSGSWG